MFALNLVVSFVRYSEAYFGFMLLFVLNLIFNSSKKFGRLDCLGREYVE